MIKELADGIGAAKPRRLADFMIAATFGRIGPRPESEDIRPAHQLTIEALVQL
jgi:hypothetical protein